jgi:hypothetical protein
MTISYIPCGISHAKLFANSLQFAKPMECILIFWLIQFYLSKIKAYSFSYQMKIMLLLVSCTNPICLSYQQYKTLCPSFTVN